MSLTDPALEALRARVASVEQTMKVLELALTGKDREIARLRAALIEVRTVLRAWNRSALEGNDIGDDDVRSAGEIIRAALAPEQAGG